MLASVFIGKPYTKIRVYGLESQIFFRPRLSKWLDIAEMKEYINQNNRMIGRHTRIVIESQNRTWRLV